MACTKATKPTNWLGTGSEILAQLNSLHCSFVLRFHSDHDTTFWGKLALLKLYIFCDVNPIYIWGIQYAPCLHTIYQNCMFFCLACALFHYLFTEGNVKWVKTNQLHAPFQPISHKSLKIQFLPFLLFAAAYFKSDWFHPNFVHYVYWEEAKKLEQKYMYLIHWKLKCLTHFIC